MGTSDQIQVVDAPKQVNRDSDTWRAVSELVEEALHTHRQNLEVPGLPADETEFARGAISSLLLIKQLGEPRIHPVEAGSAGPGGY